MSSLGKIFNVFGNKRCLNTALLRFRIFLEFTISAMVLVIRDFE